MGKMRSASNGKLRQKGPDSIRGLKATLSEFRQLAVSLVGIQKTVGKLISARDHSCYPQEE